MTKLIEYYKTEWPVILGTIIGTTWMFTIIYLAAKAIYE